MRCEKEIYSAAPHRSKTSKRILVGRTCGGAGRGGAGPEAAPRGRHRVMTSHWCESRSGLTMGKHQKLLRS